MKIINTTNSQAQLVQNQLANTDAFLVETYSAGNTDVIFTQAPLHYELLISNKYRAVQMSEIEQIRDFFLKRKIDTKIINQAGIRTIHTDRLIEMSIPIVK
ncbi:ribose-5-phosphate isomerase [Streptococcus azizii]|uniref:Ribose-5-phosphate isomerase n=1 Tax=Streptococcus azizii TaxID=1579424 RepID=A0AB36JPM7_9STRE|nr:MULTISPECIES: DUF1827 family protein [Streptococcus]MBF0775249.1 DUF1827 family protein [Streptococcus sp. 19428wD3_AN2]ONK29524.1 ribose-5-phosphate isomerase [Streptococcus azizii]ONK30033.1 ribose-5-phosphate isomerase [Streptococcus azizii]ONK30809.1 ribose-5-phosphate isomerase [Streptococcus azizii]TFU84778.1 DUF1827 family protein [Streptococcus sp. AN2]